MRTEKIKRVMRKPDRNTPRNQIPRSLKMKCEICGKNYYVRSDWNISTATCGECILKKKPRKRVRRKPRKRAKISSKRSISVRTVSGGIPNTGKRR